MNNHLNTVTKKSIYRQICGNQNIPLFSQAWWLDCTAGHENWDVAIVKKGNEVLAALPYVLTGTFLGKRIHMPLLTQTMGIWFFETGGKESTRLAREKDLVNKILSQVPKCIGFSQNFHHTITNWLPWFWSGYKQTTRYTYLIENISDIDVLWKGLSEHTRRSVRKAKDRLKLSVETDLDLNTFIDLNIKTFSRQGEKPPYKSDFIQDLDKECLKRDCRRIFFAKDESGIIHAAVYIVWGSGTAYYLMGGANPDLRNSGATSLCLWEAIKFSSTIASSFDFEGSMIESIERFFRAFGAKQKPYFCIYKYNSPFLKAAACAKDILRSL